MKRAITALLAVVLIIPVMALPPEQVIPFHEGSIARSVSEAIAKGIIATPDWFITDQSYDEMYEWATIALADTKAIIVIDDYENGYVQWIYRPDDVDGKHGAEVIYLIISQDDGTTRVEKYYIYDDERGINLGNEIYSRHYNPELYD